MYRKFFHVRLLEYPVQIRETAFSPRVEPVTGILTSTLYSEVSRDEDTAEEQTGAHSHFENMMCPISRTYMSIMIIADRTPHSLYTSSHGFERTARKGQRMYKSDANETLNEAECECCSEDAILTDGLCVDCDEPDDYNYDRDEDHEDTPDCMDSLQGNFERGEREY